MLLLFLQVCSKPDGDIYEAGRLSTRKFTFFVHTMQEVPYTFAYKPRIVWDFEFWPTNIIISIFLVRPCAGVGLFASQLIREMR
jgi:hypothetical protein